MLEVARVRIARLNIKELQAPLHDTHYFSLPHPEIAQLGLFLYSFIFINTYVCKGEIKEMGESNVHYQTFKFDIPYDLKAIQSYHVN